MNGQHVMGCCDGGMPAEDEDGEENRENRILPTQMGIGPSVSPPTSRSAGTNGGGGGGGGVCGGIIVATDKGTQP